MTVLADGSGVLKNEEQSNTSDGPAGFQSDEPSNAYEHGPRNRTILPDTRPERRPGKTGP